MRQETRSKQIRKTLISIHLWPPIGLVTCSSATNQIIEYSDMIRHDINLKYEKSLKQTTRVDHSSDRVLFVYDGNNVIVHYYNDTSSMILELQVIGGHKCW